MARYSSQFPDPVCIVTVESHGRRNAMTVGWASPVSFKPPILMVSIAPQRHTHDMFIQAAEFGVSVLSDDQKELSTLAGTISGRDVDKLALPEFAISSGNHIGAPLIQGARAWLECSLLDHQSIGDHTVFYGEILEFRSDETKNPLILFNGRYFALGNVKGDYP